MSPWLITALAGLALIGAYRHGVTVTDHKWQAQWAEQSAATAESRAEAEHAARAEEQRRQQAANEIGEHINDQAALVVDADGGRDVLEIFELTGHDELGVLNSRPAAVAITTPTEQPSLA